MIWYDVDAALSEVPINFHPLTDDTDFKSREESVTYNQAGLDLVWNFLTTAGAMTQTAVTPTDTGGNYDFVNQGNGLYTIEIPASGGASINNDTEGFGWFTGYATGILPWSSAVYGFRAAGLNNALIDSAYSATRGLAGTALPDAAADAAGGLPISDEGGLDLDTYIKRLEAAWTAALAARIDENISAAKTLTAAYDAAKTAAAAGAKMDLVDAPNATAVTAIQSGLATAAALDAVDNFVDTEVSAIKGVTDKLDTAVELDGAVYRFTTNALEQAPTGGSAPTADAIADAVWDEALAGHADVGSAGAGLTAAGSAGDPWATALPGSYGAGTAGLLLGTTIPNAIDAIDNYVDTEVGALTTELAKVPKSDSTVSFNATALAAIADAVWDEAATGHTDAGKAGAQMWTDVDAILADTNELQTDWADSGRLDLILDTTKGYADQAFQAANSTYSKVDTEVAAIKAVTDAIGATGSGLSAIPWNAAWDAEVQSECTDALNAYDPPTKAEVDSSIAAGDDAVLALLGTPAGASVSADLADIEGKVDDLEGRLTATRAGYLDNLATAPPTAAEIKTAIEAAGSSLAAILEDTGTTLDGKINTIDDFLDTEVAAILADTALIEKWILDKMVGTDNGDGTVTYVLYDTDGTTPLKTWVHTTASGTRAAAT